MLSAVVARKAAKAAAQASSTPSSKPSSPPPPSKSPSPSPQPTSAFKQKKPASKRKLPGSASSTRFSTTKKVKSVHTLAQPDRSARYFDPINLSDAQSEAIPTVEDSNYRIEISCPSGSSASEMEMEMDVPLPAGPSTVSVTKNKRAWSPSRPMPDSSDDDEPVPPLDPASYLTSRISTRPEPLLLSTFRPVPNSNVYPVPENEHATSDKSCILVLQPNETLALFGTYSLRVLQGSVSILGVTLSPSNVRHIVFAPRSSPIPILSWATSEHKGFCTFPVPLAIRQQETATAILIEHVDTGIEGLGRICRVFENIFKPPRGSVVVPGIDLPGIHIVNSGAKDIRPFVLPNSWEVALSSVDEKRESGLGSAPVCLVKGPKKSGKSTLARTLVNRLLSRYRQVAFLECDLGQSEFTPGGLVTLHVVENYVFGPPFTHPSLPYRAHYIGSTSPRASPSHYLHSIQSLLETYKLDLQFRASDDDPLPGDERIYDAIPLVVNTMGWNKGLGADLNARIEEFVDASHTFSIDGAEDKGWPTLPPSQRVPQIPAVLPFLQTSIARCIKIEAIQTVTTDPHHTATDHRHLNILSYFHGVFSELPTSSSTRQMSQQTTVNEWDTSLPLCARYPYEVDYTRAIDHIYLTGPGYEDVVVSELNRVLNGAIVGLVSDASTNAVPRPRSIQSTSEETPSLPYTPGEPLPDPGLSTCHGLALIRGMPLSVDLHSPHMHILTPLPAGLLGQTRVLVKGEMELPIWGMLDFREDNEGRVAGIEKGRVPYLQWGKGEGIGGEKRRVRRNLMRKGQT